LPHSNIVAFRRQLLPAVFATSEQNLDYARKGHVAPDDVPFFVATIVGYESGPRVGLGLSGTDMLSRGWYPEAVFSTSVSAASINKQ